MTRTETVRDYISDEDCPANVRISVAPSRETEGAVEIQLFTQSPYHATTVRVGADAREGQVEGLYRSGLLAHQRAVKNLGGA